MKIKSWIVLCGLIMIAVLDISCATGSYQDDSFHNHPYNDRMAQMAANYEGPLRNPVILIHGLLGAKIADEQGNTVWGNFSPREMAMGTHFRQLALPMEYGVPLPRLKNKTHAAGLLEQSMIKILGVQFFVDSYDILLNSLKRAGYTPESKFLPPQKHFPSLFVFYYDWRRDISENAAELHKFIQSKRDLLQDRYHAVYGLEKKYDIQFDLVGHSMGGLLARYYLRYGGKILPDTPQKLSPPDWAGAKFVDKVLIIGTPNSGYSDTLLELKNGLRLVTGSPAYPPAVLGTFPSIYEMLPSPESGMIREKDTGEKIDLYDVEVWKKYRWGLADPEQDSWFKELIPQGKSKEERAKIALDHLQKILIKAKLFREAISCQTKKYPENVSVWLIAGNTVETNALLEVDQTGHLTVAERAAGDGKITFASCCQDLRAGENWYPFMISPIQWQAVYPVPGGHMGIMKSPYFDSILRYILLDTRLAGNGD